MANKCWECGSDENIQFHHVVPKSRGGKKVIALCGKCHELVHGMKNLRNSSFNTLKKMQDLKQKGFCTGRPPFGYKELIDGKLEKCDHEQKILRLVDEWRENGETLQSCANMLNKAGLTNRGKKWNRHSVSRCCSEEKNGNLFHE